MSRNIEREFQGAMSGLAFSSHDKKRLLKNVMPAGEKHSKGEVIIMKTKSIPKAAAIALAGVVVTGGTALAASRILTYEASSPAYYEYNSAADMNAEEGTQVFPETLGAGYVFDGGNDVYVSGKDDAGNTLGKWTDQRAEYHHTDGTSVSLSVSGQPADDNGRTPTATREIAETTVAYNYDEYLLLPDESAPLDPAVKERMETDDHFFVSYGGEEQETYFFRSVSFEKNGVSYNLNTMDEISEDELFSMAEELLTR